MKRLFVVGVLAVVASAVPASGQDRGRHPVIDAALRCRAIADNGERVRCYDAAMQALDQSIAAGTLVARAPEPDEPDLPPEIRTTVASVAMHRGYYWMITLREGGTWRTTENTNHLELPRSGQSAVLTRAGLGGRFLRVGNGTPVRVAPVRQRGS